MTRVFFLSFIIFLLAAPSALAVGIVVDPSELSMSGTVGEEATVRLRVKNPGETLALFEAAPDTLGDMVRAFPSSFTLESGEERDIVVRVVPANPGVFKAVLSVSSHPLSGNFQVGSGIKIPLMINVARSSKPLATILLSEPYLPWTLLAVVSALFISLETRRRLKKI